MQRSTKRKKNSIPKPNLIPILDAVFIFIFFLLMSAQFVKFQEIGSDSPISLEAGASDDKKRPLALTIKISKNDIKIFTGVPAKLRRKISASNGNYDLVSLHNEIFRLKKYNLKEEDAIISPERDVSYELIVKIVDEIRSVNKSDPPLYQNIKGQKVVVKSLFHKIAFGE